MGGLHITGRIYDRICTSSWSSRVHLDGSGGSIYVKLIGHVGVAYTLAACKQPDGYLRGNCSAKKYLPLCGYFVRF
jgi:hypothetical protein